MTPSRARPADAADAIAPRDLARMVRDACLDTALEAYETAGLGGLCAEGRWEAAVDAIRSLNPDAILAGEAPMRGEDGAPDTGPRRDS